MKKKQTKVRTNYKKLYEFHLKENAELHKRLDDLTPDKPYIGYEEREIKVAGPVVEEARYTNPFQTTRPDNINHPSHYKSHPSGIECIEIVRHMNFNRGNAIKYIWRAGQKLDELHDLSKAIWYLKDEIERIKNAR